MKMKRLLLLAWFLPLLMACALLGENLPLSPSASPSPAMEPTASAPSSVPTLVPTPTSAPASLQMVFSTTDGIFLWREGAGTRFLTAGDRDLPSRVRLSQDGQVIAFLRGGELFAINADGTGERMLVSRDYLEANRPAGEDIVAIGIDSFAFLPGTHDVLFSLSVETISFPLLLEDLHRVNADAPSPARLLAERQGGGRWFPAPDGQSIILVRASQIALFRLATQEQRLLMEFPMVNTQSEWIYYPSIVWKPDSSGVFTVIPPQNLLETPAQPHRFYSLSVSGEASLLTEFSLAEPKGYGYAVSPDGKWLAHLAQEAGEEVIYVREQSGMPLPVLRAPSGTLLSLLDWSPEPAKLLISKAGEAGELMVISPDGTSRPLRVNPALSFSRLAWVDANRILIGSTDLILYNLLTDTAQVIMPGVGQNADFDFVLVP